MIEQIIKYFRFDSYEDEDGNIFYAPPSFKGREEYYEGYNLSPYAIDYSIKRDVDFEPDTFTITVESYFFQNPLNESHYAKLKLTDTKNAFEPTTNHVIVIGPSPKLSDVSGTNGAVDSYCYEDKYPEISSPVFGLVKSCSKSGSDKMVITCVSFLKVLNDFQLGTDYKLNHWASDVNDMQIYYEYREDEDESSDPYFAPKDITRRSTNGRYMITPAVETYDKDERFPMFPTFNVGNAIANMKYGYEAPKIAHRLLQEVGWCRDGYKTECLESAIPGKTAEVVSPYVSTGFINPYQQFRINRGNDDPSLYYNKNIMTATETIPHYLKFNFSAFESDGLRYDYNSYLNTNTPIYYIDSSEKYFTWTDGVFIKQKTIEVLEDPVSESSFEVSFEIRGAGTNSTTQVYGRVYKNGVALGTIRIKTGPAWLKFTETFNVPLYKGDTIELWCYQKFGTGDGGYCRNFEFIYKPKILMGQTYYSSYDTSRQSILYNLKSLADSDSMFLTVTCCPRFVKTSELNETTMVWDYKRVYGDTTNLKRWGVTAGFRPKLLLRRNIAQSLGELPDEYEIAVGTISYGTFNSDPTLPNRNPVLAKSISWETDQSDVINKVAIKYGQGSNDLTKYVELPSEQPEEKYFYIELEGEVANAESIVKLNIKISTGIVKTLERRYPVGVQDYQIVKDIGQVYNKDNDYYEIETSGNVIWVSAKTEDVKDYWFDNQDSVSLTISKTSGMKEDSLGANVEFMTTEPEEFTIARDSQKRNGIKAAKISLPEITSYSDVISISSKIFKKLANEKFRCVVNCNDINDWQLPIFKLFNIKDVTNSKQILNDEGAAVKFKVVGTTTTTGRVMCILPHPDITTHFGFTTTIAASKNNKQVATAIAQAFNGVTEIITATVATDTGDEPNILSYTGSTIVFRYNVDEKFPDNYKFDLANIRSTDPGIRFYRYIAAPGQFKQSAYDEQLMLLNYEANSKSGTHVCTFGLPDESLANIINQSINWIADIEKGQ